MSRDSEYWRTVVETLARLWLLRLTLLTAGDASVIWTPHRLMSL